MKRIAIATALPALIAVLGLSACSGAMSGADCKQCGEIASIEARKVEGEASPMAAVAGAIIGGVAGNQVGSGSGKDAATAAGAVGGAVAGKEVSEETAAHTVYDVTVDMRQGGERELTLASRAGLSVGQEVRVTDDRIEPM
ncbi:glycine zipper 2TM domain-containing protein [Algiphilus sp.]|uniref:glycine zipper 2TM domain-containing protein n=1 Tax=Algiphilus sp. TaxID=1872431 RepID=UPI001CA77EA9|nr:glycine zipper 2TM domain-containing protein [Algiphilus sp.]MBY8964606.1 glycine zipper 2TM domain-containing protein [Algiphilus acroporae]MCI5062946.1 glycine zipper 2TM domain-containing protein [Algiphilus sp.]MCI5103264.1 glycine zipper 2TM domain-containing protein [Algiphilus sp.]